MPIKTIIVDDNVFLIQTIKEKISFFEDLELAGTANNGKQLLVKLDKGVIQPDLILMDIEMPKLNGIEATAQIKSKYPHIKVIMLTVFDDHNNIFNAIKAGANGYLLKETPPEKLHKSILEVMAGGAPMSPTVAAKALQLLRNPTDLRKPTDQEQVKLTNRETEVLTELSKGLTYKEIAQNFVRSPKTIRNHIERIYKKLQVHSKLEAIQKARRNYLI